MNFSIFLCILIGQNEAQRLGYDLVAEISNGNRLSSPSNCI